jgi:hypothetical protein
MNKIYKISILILVLAFITIEFLLRVMWGFGTMPLYLESNKYEYIFAPNQEMNRFGVHFYTNSFSQRSNEPDNNRKIVLGLGDSVINGGSQTDNESLATSIVSARTEYQMLNISAGSWGADNCAAYLKEQGLFDAKAMFVVLSSHDVNDSMDFAPTVGVHKSYPKENYPLAIFEVLDRYILPRLIKTSVALNPDEKVLRGIDKGGEFNKGWNELKEIASSANIPMILILHAEMLELEVGEYNEKGKMIEQWAIENEVRLIKDIAFLKKDNYRDNIHVNSSGQRVLADLMIKELSAMSL